MFIQNIHVHAHAHSDTEYMFMLAKTYELQMFPKQK